MSRHASLDDLASFIEGVLKPRKYGKIAAHVAGCSLCTGHVQDLQQMPVMLSNLAFPPIPDELSVRISAAIHTESTVRVTTPGSVSGEAGRRDLPERSRPARRRWRMPGFSSPLAGSLAAVGAAVIIAGGGYEIASHAGGTSTTSSGSASPAHSGLAPAAAAGGQRVAMHAQNGPDVQFRANGQTQTTPSVRTSTDFVPARLQAQALAALAYVRAGAFKAAQGVTNDSPQASAATTLSGCVSSVAAGRNVLLVDIAHYEGKVATIIVVGKPPAGPGTIYVAGAGCSASNRHILAQQQLPVQAP
jgi:hypothetical protein